MSEVKLCRNCKYAKKDAFGWEYSKCLHGGKAETSINKVTGKIGMDNNIYYCSTMRNYECGSEGVFFEQKVTIWTTIWSEFLLLWNKLP